MKLRHPREGLCFYCISKDFEGHQITCYEGYKRYLRLIWGDYMPITTYRDNDVAKHDAVFADLHTPYKGV